MAVKCLQTRIYTKQNNLPDIYLVLKLIEIFTLVQKEEINDAIDFINFKLGKKVARFSAFWSFFPKVWFINYDHELWNINKTEEKNMAEITNNAINRYNRIFGEFFFKRAPKYHRFRDGHQSRI
ncbi:hypothetical protein HZS_272 [Henneguya salminicola]|nr:hypothetical protein HZS_272 [Henneguya salminicola]